MSKLLDKVSKVLNQAENAGTPEEAAAFMAKAQEMASVAGIELAVARMHQAKKERVQEPEERRIQVNPRDRRHNKKHFMDLAIAIAEVNDVAVLISRNEVAIFGVGFPSDLDVVEALFTHLSIQMVTECDEALARGEHREVKRLKKTTRVEIPWDEREWGQWNGRTYYDDDPCGWIEDEERRAGAQAAYLDDVKHGREQLSPVTDSWGNSRWRKPVPPPAFKDEPVLDDEGQFIWEEKEVSVVDGRVFRGNFYAAFVTRMQGRLWEIRRSAEREAGALEVSSEVALAVRDKKAEVDAADKERRAKVHHMGTYSGAASENRARDHTGTARQAGRNAAERVPVGNEGRSVKT